MLNPPAIPHVRFSLRVFNIKRSVCDGSDQTLVSDLSCDVVGVNGLELTVQRVLPLDMILET